MPRGHWLLVGLLMLVFTLGLLVEGFSHGVLGETSAGVARAAGGPSAPAAVLHGGPVINATGAHPFSYRMRPHTVALTFDDGPDPVWTPRILAVLRRYHVPATFFVVGAHAAAYPGLVRSEMTASLPDDAPWTPPELAPRLVRVLASGRADRLCGRYLHAEHDDIEELIRRADEIRDQDLNAIRLRR